MPVPATMTAIEITQPGPPEVLRATQRPVPQPGADEILIRVVSAGVNRADVSQRLGRYPMPPGAPDIPGLECAGEVVGLGEAVRDWRIGDAVCALLAGGGYAEYVAAPVAQCLRLPPSVDIIDAGGLPETYCTVWTNVFERCRLQAGEVLLVQGGSSGIGTTAIQLAKAFGARVIVTAGSDEKCRACEALGADRAINYRREDFVAVGLDFTGGRGVDVILDMVAGSYIQRELELLAHGGRLCFVALMGGPEATVNFGLVHRKHLTVTGSTLRPRSVAEKGAICRALETRVWPLFAEGKCRPMTYRRVPLAQAAKAHRLMEASTHIGKILLVADPRQAG